MSSQSTTRTAALVLIAAVGILYIAREVLIPVALAILFAFLLAPIVQFLVRRGFNRIVAVLLTTTLAMAVAAAIGAVVVMQTVDLANNLPSYKSNLKEKIVSIKPAGSGPFSRAAAVVRELAGEFEKPAENAAPEAPEKAPVPVEVVGDRSTPFQTIRAYLEPLLSPLGTMVIVICFVIFVLLEREDLRDRVIHLIGRSRLPMTTQALDEAAQRVSRFLLAQLLVNAVAGMMIGIGLWFIGIPNALLWGLFGMLLRFVPYIGPWIGAIFPMIVSMAVSDDWAVPIWTALLYIGVELITSNVFEPWLYGSSTGLSPVAVIVSAVFWTWIWGPVGLVLATPLTVCLSVLGKYIPGLEFIDVLVGDNPRIATDARFYQRLLARDAEEAVSLAETHVSTHSLAETYGGVLLPTLVVAARDLGFGVVDDELREPIFATIRDLSGSLAEMYRTVSPEGGGGRKVWCVAPHDEADEIAGGLLQELLRREGIFAKPVSAKILTGELIGKLEAAEGESLEADVIVISAVPPGSVMPAVSLCKRLRTRFEGVPIVVGLWTDPLLRRRERLERAGATSVVSTLEEAVAQVKGYAAAG